MTMSMIVIKIGPRLYNISPPPKLGLLVMNKHQMKTNSVEIFVFLICSLLIKGGHLGPVSRKLSLSSTQFHSTRADRIG